MDVPGAVHPQLAVSDVGLVFSDRRVVVAVLPGKRPLYRRILLAATKSPLRGPVCWISGGFLFRVRDGLGAWERQPRRGGEAADVQLRDRAGGVRGGMGQ